MADTTFQSQVTVMTTEWAQQINDHVFRSTPIVPAAAVHPASFISFSPFSYLTSVTTQAAIEEVVTELEASGGSSLVGFIQFGTGAVARTIQDSLRETVSVFDFMTAAEIADVEARTGLVNVTTSVQNAIDHCSTYRKKLYAPSGKYLGNWTIKSNVIIIGENEAATIFQAYLDAPVFTTLTNTSTVRIGWRDCTISGDVTHTVNGDGVRLGTTTAGTWVDTIELHNVRITGNGRYGLYAFGSSSAGPFVQKLRVTNCTISDQMNDSGLFLHGKIIESKFTACALSNNGDAAGVHPNAQISLNSTATNRVQFDTCMFNHINSSGVGYALIITHAEAVSLKNCNFESASPYIYISGALAKNISIDTCSFGSNYACPVAIMVDDCHGLNVQNCAFDTCDVALDLSTTYSRISNVQFGESNKVNVKATKSVDYPATPLRVVYGAIARNLEYQVIDVVNASDISDDLDYITGHSTQYTVNGAVDNGSGLIRITTSATSSIPTGSSVHVQNIGGVPNADGIWTVTAIDSTTYDLQGSTFAGAYSSAGFLLQRIDGALNDQSTITIRTANSARDVVVKHNTGNILLDGAADVTLVSANSHITLKYNSQFGKWMELGRCIV